MLNKQVGLKLGISEMTMKAHRGKMMQKMKADSLADLVKIAVRLDLARARNLRHSRKGMIAFCAEAIETTCQASKYLEREPGSQLDLSSRRRGFGYGSELRSIHKPIRCAQISVVERIKRLSANLKLNLLGD